MILLNILLGAALLLFGRRLYWLFVGGIGFVAGMGLAQLVMGRPAETWAIIAAVLAGFIGALLALFMQRLALRLAGFVGGGYLLCLPAFNNGNEGLGLILFLVGGIIGALMVMLLFNWALILISALVGATLVSEATDPDAVPPAVTIAVLSLVGIFIQAGLKRKNHGPPKERR